MLRSKEPTYPLALGLWVAHERDAGPTHPPSDPQIEAELTSALAERESLRVALDGHRRDAQGAARVLGQNNQGLAEQLPKLEKLRQDSQALRKQQDAALVQVEMQRLRRQRAELNVRIQDIEAVVQNYEASAATARTELATAQREQLALSDRLRELDNTLLALQQRAAPLAAVFLALEQQLMRAHAGLFVAVHDPAGLAPGALTRWHEAFLSVCEATLDVHDAMAQGRYPERQTLAFRGGRARLCGEVVWGLIALGDWSYAQLAFGRMCGSEAALHQMDAVFRAYSAGLVLGGEAQLELLADLSAMHRFEQTERGALAQALWSLLDEDDAALRRAQRAYARAEWQAREREDKPGLGLISVTSMGIARLAQERGMAAELVPGPQAPTSALMRLGQRRTSSRSR